MLGKIPAVADGVVSRRVCFAWKAIACQWSSSILVVNCGFNVTLYNLPAPPAFCLRYCGAGNRTGGLAPSSNSGQTVGLEAYSPDVPYIEFFVQLSNWQLADVVEGPSNFVTSVRAAVLDMLDTELMGHNLYQFGSFFSAVVHEARQSATNVSGGILVSVGVPITPINGALQFCVVQLLSPASVSTYFEPVFGPTTLNGSAQVVNSQCYSDCDRSDTDCAWFLDVWGGNQNSLDGSSSVKSSAFFSLPFTIVVSVVLIVFAVVGISVKTRCWQRNIRRAAFRQRGDQLRNAQADELPNVRYLEDLAYHNAFLAETPLHLAADCMQPPTYEEINSPDMHGMHHHDDTPGPCPAYDTACRGGAEE
jgi:hypothetical protein